MRWLGCLAVLLSVGGCTTSLKLAPTDVDLILRDPSREIAELRYKLLKVENAEIGIRMVNGRYLYLTDFFRQSVDPYFGGERWSAECLQKNKVGELEQKSRTVSFRSRLTADDSMKTGLCSPDGKEVILLVGFCRDTQNFYEVAVRGAKTASFVCPNSLEVTK